MGETGRGIERTEIVDNNLVIYYTDNTSETHTLEGLNGDPNEKEVLVFSKLSDGTYGVMAGGMAKYEAVIEIPATYNDVPVTQILPNGFANLPSSQEIVIPYNIRAIGNNAFKNCTGLSKIVFPDSLQRIEEYAFYGCSSLTTISIPDTVSFIGKYAFVSSGLISATFTDSTGWKLTPYISMSTVSTRLRFEYFDETSCYYSEYYTYVYSYNLSEANKAANALIKEVQVSEKLIHTGSTSSGTEYDYVSAKLYTSDWENPTAVETPENTPETEQSVGVSEVTIVNDELIITLSNGNEFNLGNVKGEKGDKGDKGDKGEQGEQGIQGVSITEVTLTAEGELSMKFSNGQVIPLGNIKGQDGTDGVGIANTEINADGNLVITYTNGVTKDLGSVKGPKGDKGDQGEQGPKGEDGVDGKSAYELYKQAHPEYTGTFEDWLNSLKGETGRGILRTEFSGTNFVIYYTDGTSETHDLSDMFGDPNEKEVLVYSLLSDGTYGVMAGGMAKYEATIEIPETYNGVAVTQIISDGFKDLTSLQTVILPENIITVGYGAFNNCTSLKNINLSSNLQRIEPYAFCRCASLTNINIPANVSFIGAYAFSETALTSATIDNYKNWTTDPMPYLWNKENSKDLSALISVTTATTTNFSFVYSSYPTSYTRSYSLATDENVAAALSTRIDIEFVTGPNSSSTSYCSFEAYKCNWYCSQ